MILMISIKFRQVLINFSKMAENLVRQLNENHQILVKKISSIERHLSSDCCKHFGSKTSMESVPNNNELEKQKLVIENQNLQEEIIRLRKRLTELEILHKGAENVTPLKMLNEISLLKCSNQSSNVDSKPSLEISTESKDKKKDDIEANNKPKIEKTSTDEKSKEKKNKNQPKEVAPKEGQIDASRLDLRVGKIIDVKKHPDADSLYLEQIDVGEENPRTVVSGLVKFVPIEMMQDRMVVVLCNLKPAKMRGIVSEAMVMCASTPEKVEILSPPEGSVPGDRVKFLNYPGQPDAQLNPKKKIWEQIAPDLSTNDQLEATYKGDQFIVEGKGTVKSQSLKNVPVK
uniref:Aminoacyl tRNA synthase complex-interacting multifunctional protein 1 n=1 Tax=Sarcoptes scabiei TaxID=52283 RepID=A0A834VG95_SARSC